MKNPIDLIAGLGVVPVFAIGGAWTEDIREGRFTETAKNAAAAVKVAKEALEKRA